MARFPKKCAMSNAMALVTLIVIIINIMIPFSTLQISHIKTFIISLSHQSSSPDLDAP